MRVVALIVCFFLFNGLYSQPIRHPFPVHSPYLPYSIQPKGWTQTTLDSLTFSFYKVWKKEHLRNDPNHADLYYIYDNEGKDKSSGTNSICVSEGQGYGMMITVLMAGADPNAQNHFDGLFLFSRKHPSSNSPYLMSWSIDKNFRESINNEETHSSSATDGDMDIAFSLLLADSQWGSGGEINYRLEAERTLDAIKKKEVNGKHFTLMLCDDFKADEPENNDIRSSDFMPDHLREFYNFDHDSLWLKTLDKTYSIFNHIQTKYSPVTGLIPDFIQYTKLGYQPAQPNYLESLNDGRYYYNACRVPLRISTDFLLFGDQRAKDLLIKINSWVAEKSKHDPDAIWSGYTLSGANIKSNDYTTPAFTAPLTVSLMVDPRSQNWLNTLFQAQLNNKFKDYKYYDNTINLISLIILSGNYWTPASYDQTNKP